MFAFKTTLLIVFYYKTLKWIKTLSKTERQVQFGFVIVGQTLSRLEADDKTGVVYPTVGFAFDRVLCREAPHAFLMYLYLLQSEDRTWCKKTQLNPRRSKRKGFCVMV